MRSFNFSDLKEQAKKAGSLAESKVSGLRQNWNNPASPTATSSSAPKTYPPPPPPAAKKPALPPPRQVAGASPALPARSSSGHVPTRSTAALASSVAGDMRIPWGSLSHQDKAAFFALLDEYFVRRGYQEAPVYEGEEEAAAPAGGRGPPPPVVLRSRPSATHTQSALGAQTFSLDTPPSSSTASSFAELFLPHTLWSSAWYDMKASGTPPLLEQIKDVRTASSWSTYGDQATRTGYVLFADLSVCWYRVTWSVRNPRPESVSREAYFRTPPAPWDSSLLVWAHELYGELVAGFAEAAFESGQPVARGECWDMANSALQSISTSPDTASYPAPVPSISRTHGHLMYAGQVEGGREEGRWRGGDDRIRRGDIVEWNTARVRMGNATMTLGNPEHTAVVIAASPGPLPVSDGATVLPRELGWIEVVEQSQGKRPSKQRYEMGGMDKGKVWFYRPVPMEDYVGEGIGLDDWPPKGRVEQIE